MARRQMRAFTFSQEISQALDSLLTRPEVLKFFVAQATLPSTTPTTRSAPPPSKAPPPAIQLPALDDLGLTPSDYEELYRLMPAATPHSNLVRTLDSRTFRTHIDLCFNSNPSGMDRMLAAVNRRIMERKKQVVQAKRQEEKLVKWQAAQAERLAKWEAAQSEKERATRLPVINHSRIAEMVVALGLAALEERVSEIEGVERSARSNATQSSNKLPVTKRRKGIAI